MRFAALSAPCAAWGSGCGVCFGGRVRRAAPPGARGLWYGGGCRVAIQDQNRGGMKRERIVEFVGGSEEEIAWLRLSLRKAASELKDAWRLRREGDSHVDLLVIHDLDEAGVAVPTADGDREPRVRLIDPVFGAAGMETARWPLSRDKLVRLFNLTSHAATRSPPAVAPAIQHNVYDDLFAEDSTGPWQPQITEETPAGLPELGEDWVASLRSRGDELMREAEAFFRQDLRLAHKDVLQAIELHEAVDVEATEGQTRGTAARQDKRAGAGALAVASYPLSAEQANLRHPFIDYLGARLLPGPARIQACELQLVLDPRNRVYYARGGLCIYEELCRQSPRHGDWQLLTSFEFSDVRRETQPRPYAELLWLCVYANDSTRPPFDEDGQGHYRLNPSIDLQRDFPRAARVARELEKGSSLSTAAHAARVPLSEARRVAAAFDAIGELVREEG